jgi:hypothetical protein
LAGIRIQSLRGHAQETALRGGIVPLLRSGENIARPRGGRPGQPRFLKLRYAQEQARAVGCRGRSGRLLFSAGAAALQSLWLVIGWRLGSVQLNRRRQLGDPPALPTHGE